ncbi:MAG: hypothetical protein AAGA03_00020 [Planctomycetota bacterium]
MDVALGSMLLALLLVPATRVLRESRTLAHRLDVRESLLFQAERTIEATKVTLSEPAAFASALSGAVTIQPNPGAEYPGVQSQITLTVDRSVPGSTNLITINVQTWQDVDGDNRIDQDEPVEQLRTQWGPPQ